MSALACATAAAFLATGCGDHVRAYGDGGRIARVEAWSDDERPAENNAIPMVWAFSFPPLAAGRVDAADFTTVTVGEAPFPRSDLRGSLVYGARESELSIELQRRIGRHWVPVAFNGRHRLDSLLPLPTAPAAADRDRH